MRFLTRHFLRRLLTLWVTLALLTAPLSPLRAADLAAAGQMADSDPAMASMSGSSTQMDGTSACEACNAVPTSQRCGGTDCAQGGCVHGSCSVWLLRQVFSDSLSREPDRSQPVIAAGYRSHQPGLPKRPPIR